MATSGDTVPVAGWPFLLADLALILFLITLTGLPGEAGSHGVPLGRPPVRSENEPPHDPAIAPAQALYRPASGGPGLTAWLADQPRDPRATLTIFARYARGGERKAWEAARGLADEAAASGLAVRTIITAGEEPDLYASLAYDAPPARLP